MARYLLADNPVKYWRDDGTLVDGFITNRGAWCIGQGYAALCTLGVRDTASVGWLQTDGTFCKVYSEYGHNLWQTIQVVNGPVPKCFAYHSNGTKIYDLEICYEAAASDMPWEAYYSQGKVSAVMFGTQGASAIRCLQDGWDGPWKLFRFINGGWIAVTETIFATQGVTVVPVLSYAGGSLFYACMPDGRYALADADSGEVIFNDKWIDGFSTDSDVFDSFTYYANDLGVFISVVSMQTTNANGYHYSQLRVYANEGVPTQLTDPVALQPVTRLGASVLQTTVLGAQDDPIEGCTVSWGLTGAGTLLDTQSVTDIDGKATARYVGPNSFGASELVTVEVAT